MFAPSRRQGGRERRLGPVLCLLAVAAVAGCDSGPERYPGDLLIGGEPVTRETRGRLVVLGIDGLPPDTLRTAMEDGHAPNFRRLAREGALGVVNVRATGLPPLSPRVWTSFATGQVPHAHGLTGFTYRDTEGRELLYSSAQRKAPAIWNIATGLGRSIGVVNWWASAPAEVVDGFMISDLYADVAMAARARSLGAGLERDAKTVVYPPSLMRALRAVTAVDRKIGISPRRAEEVDGNVFELAQVGIEQYPVEVLLVYTRGFDELAHMTWHTHERLPGEDPGGGDAVIDFLQRYDWLLGRFLNGIGPDDHLMLLSDHGFERYADPNVGGGTHESAQTARALFYLKGPRIRVGVNLHDEIDVLDVLPTMLELAGLPSAMTLPGRIAAEAFLPEERNFLTPVSAYELARPVETPKSAGESIGDDAMKERLRALGYLDDAHDGK
jgi:hypothetical protein